MFANKSKFYISLFIGVLFDNGNTEGINPSQFEIYEISAFCNLSCDFCLFTFLAFGGSLELIVIFESIKVIY